MRLRAIAQPVDEWMDRPAGLRAGITKLFLGDASAQSAALAYSHGDNQLRDVHDPPIGRWLIQFNALDLNPEQYVLLESIPFTVIHAKIGAIKGARCVGAADFLLEHRMFEAFE
jgi:hypothetical protein